MGLVSNHGGLARNEGWISKLLLIDYSSLLYKGLAVNQELTYKGTYTGGLNGLVNQLGTLVREHRPEHAIFCADWGPYYRKTAVFPAYKEDRSARKSNIPPEAFDDTLRLGKKFLEVADLPVWQVKGWEADDLFALAVKKYHRRYDRIIIASADDDLFQLLSYDNVYLCKKDGLYGSRRFKQDYPALTPEDWVIFNALKGGHNNYKGLKGVGAVKALEIMADDDKLDAVYAEHKDVLDVGLKVCALPLPKSVLPEGVTYPEVPEPHAPQPDELAVKDYLMQYGIRPGAGLTQALTHLSAF